ncbi:probable chitinase 10 [Hermetia illucens]|uniref:probable chitinase 10 n=1 Tax=Hermetia illucens TaxID=343691 RepID=UPI0018CC4834|nr:probable chitinase 10 [Hermetia illucens]
MGTLRNAVHVLLLAMLLTVRGAHEPPPGQPAFIRSAVESMPRPTEIELSKFSLAPTFGEVFLPLRSAVESAPAAYIQPEEPAKTFIRSAVEQRPSDQAYSETAHLRMAPLVEEIAKQDHLSAFVSPDHYDIDSPQPYRSGSPYQALVDVETVKEEIESENLANLRTASRPERYQALGKTKGPKVLCYMTNWSNYRKKDGKFAPENLDTSLCTAVIYSFASLDPTSLMIKEFDPWIDLENDLYKRTTSLNIPVLLALGGWTDSTGDKYSNLVSNPSSRQAFAANLVGFLVKYGFRGLHLDWNYPKCWQSDCSKGPASDKPNFTQLIKDIKREFNRLDPDLQLGVAISGYKEVIQEAYELEALSKYADYLTVMSYDYHGAWEMRTGHVSPLFGKPGDKFPQYNTDHTIRTLVEGGAAREKIILGIPFYGQTFTLTQSYNNLVGEGIPSRAPGEPGEFTRQPGMMAYYEICYRINNNRWQVGRDNSGDSGPYAMLRNQWVSFEDPQSIEKKAKYVMDVGLGGIAAWTVDLDDFQNRCCREAFPLLKTINRALGRINSPAPSGQNCQRPPKPVTPAPPVMTTVSENGMPPMHEHTTWPSWSPSPTTSMPTTTTNRPWWEQPASSSPSTWWPQTPTEITTPRPRPTTTTTRRTTPKPATTTQYYPPPPSTTIPPPAVIMPIYENDQGSCDPGTYKEDPHNCNSYYQCVYGELKQQFCAGGLHWNNRNKLCDWPEAAQCDQRQNQAPQPTTQRPRPTTQRPRPTTTTVRTTPRTKPTRPPTTPRPPSYEPLGSPADGCISGQFYPHSECDRFHMCINNQLLEQSCGAALAWNTNLNSCDWADNVNCISRSKFLKLIDSRLAPDDPCEGNEYAPYPGDCTQYLRCLWDRLEAYSCAPGLHWNNQARICDWPANAQCTQSEGVDNTIGEPGKPPPQGQHSTPRPITTRPSTTPRPTYPTDRPVLEPLSGYYKVVCYFTNWAWYRKGFGRYTPDDINTDLCTHIVYGFAVLDYSDLIIKTHDSWADIENNFYTRVSGLRGKGVKVSLALGGWNDSQGDKYSRLVRNPSARARFVRQAVEFIEKYGFEGLDLDWEYPVCWQTECNKGFPDEKEGFTALVRELSQAFKPKGLLLSTAVSPSKKIIDAGYDVPELSKYFDWIAVMTYDFHGQWDKKTGHVAPIFYHPEDDFDYFNSNFSLHYWIEKGAPSRKIVMGMPLYGQSFSLADPKVNGLNAPAPGPGQAGEYTRAAGFLAYYEICDRIKSGGWTVVQDEYGRMGPYAYKGNQWVSFDDKETIRRKSQMVRALNLGGGMVWALDLDDFKNRCGDGVHPLLTQIHNVLKDPPSGYEPEPGLLEPEAPQVEEIPPEQQPILGPSDPNLEIEELPVAGGGTGIHPVDNAVVPSSTDYKVVCYFTNWAWYRQGNAKFLPEDIDGDLCTHIVYGFAVLNRDSLTIKPHDSWADIDNNFYDRVVAYKKKGIKVTLAIGGWNDSAGDKYSRLVRDPAARARFVRHVIEFIEKYGFEGLDLDWEYPVCWQVDCTKGYEDEKEGFTALVRELSHAFKPRGLLLSSAVSPNQKVIDAGYDVPALSEHFDWIAVMTYDYHGQWDKKTGHVAPMYVHPESEQPTFNANFTINYWIEKGADRRKLVMGMPMYGQSFSLAENKNHNLNAPTYGGGEAGDGTRARGFLSYYEICQYIRDRGWQVVRDRRGRIGPYAYNRDQWVSFDDAPMIRHKSEYVKAMGLGGAMIWALDLDDFRNLCKCEKYPLLKTINRVLRNYPGPHPMCKLEDKAELAPEIDNAQLQATTHRPQPHLPVTMKPTSGRPTTKRPTTQWPYTTRSTTAWPYTTRSTTAWPYTTRPTTAWPYTTRSTTVWPYTTQPTWQYTQSTTPRPIYTTPRPTYTPPPYSDIHETGPVGQSCNGKVFAPHPTDCNKYYICQFDILAEQRCPTGLYWNNGYCDWPQNTKCQSLSDSVGSAPTTARPAAPTTARPAAPTHPKPDGEKPTKKPFETPSKKPSTQRPKPPIVKPPPVSGDGQYKVVCYFTNWAWYRPGEGKYTPDDIDDSLCTHIVYGFAVLNPNTLTIKTHDSWADIDNRFYERVVEYKKKGIRVTLAIGGWNDSLGDKYSRLVLNPQARARFIKHVIEFLEKYGFEGLDLDWEYPVCWQVECNKGKPEEKQGFASLVRELSQEFRPRGLLLSSAVSPSKMVIDAGYDVPELARYFDWIAVMTYDFHGHWDKQTGHVAPLYYYPGDTYDYFNGNFSIHYWIEKGTPPNKLVMGMPLYGQSFSLADTNKRGLNEKSYGPGEAGQYTRSGGFLAYYEICENINRGGWTVVRDPEGRIGPYAYKGNQWVSYDDVSEIRRKSDFVRSLRLGGGMVWALDLDDFRGRCGCGKHPLLRTLNQELRGISGQRANDCT